MSNEWDEADNSVDTAILQRERQREQQRNTWAEQRAIRDAARMRRREAMGFFVPRGLSDEELTDNFPHLVSQVARENPYRHNGLAAGWLANKLFYVCHNCGSISYKCTHDISELFKCSCCRSRNIVVLRAGEISLAIRDTGIGLDMQEVYNGRRERLRRERAQRAAQRRDNTN